MHMRHADLLRLNLRIRNRLGPLGSFQLAALGQGFWRAGLDRKANACKLFMNVFALRGSVDGLVEFGNNVCGVPAGANMAK